MAIFIHFDAAFENHYIVTLYASDWGVMCAKNMIHNFDLLLGLAIEFYHS